MLFLESLLVGVLVWHVCSELLHRKEREKLEDRIMASNLNEYKYFEKKYPMDIKLVDKINKKQVETDIEEKPAEDKAAEEFVAQCDEDWDKDEIDSEKLKEIVNKPEIENERRT